MITQLTAEQKKQIPKYAEMGIRIGLAIDKMDEEFPTERVRELTDGHRVMCGLAPATNFVVLDSPMAAMKDPRFRGLTPSNALYGQHDINWLMYNLYFRIECGLVKETDQIIYLLELAKLTGWMWMSSNTTVVTRRPVELHLKARAEGPQVLHNTTGYAIEYRDGTGVCIVGGTRIPREHEHLILDRTMTPNARVTKILKIRNTEIRGALLTTLPPGVMVSALGAKVINKDKVKNGGEYRLYEVMVRDSRRHYLSGTCPSKGDHWFEAVPPDCLTVKQALSWREWGQLQLPYLPPVIRT